MLHSGCASGAVASSSPRGAGLMAQGMGSPLPPTSQQRATIWDQRHERPPGWVGMGVLAGARLLVPVLCCPLPRCPQVYVLKRPHVDEFLQRMGELFECVLFTASLAKVGAASSRHRLPFPGHLWGGTIPFACLPMGIAGPLSPAYPTACLPLQGAGQGN